MGIDWGFHGDVMEWDWMRLNENVIICWIGWIVLGGDGESSKQKKIVSSRILLSKIEKQSQLL